MALVQRSGDVRAFPLDDVKATAFKEIIRDNIDKSSVLMTDEFYNYRRVGKEFAGHEAVCHALDEYVGGSAYVNTAESFFSVMKRGIKGVYQYVSKGHLHRYTDEFGFRWNTRRMRSE